MRWLALALSLCLLACNPARALIATPNDYAAYRRVRVAETADGRLAAAWDYLKDHPEGRYAERLQRYVDEVEPVFYKIRRQNVAGLEAYLKAMPDGPHAEEALRRLMLLTGQQRREAADLRAFSQTQERLDARQKQRREAGDLVIEWALLLLDPEVWRVPMAQGPGRFVVRYELSLPQPLCEARDEGGRRCMKAIEKPYDVVTTGERFDRSVAFDLELILDRRGRPLSAQIRGPGLFVRSEEAEGGKPIDDLDEGAVKEAQRDFAARLGERILEANILCEGTTEPDGRTALDCEGVELVLEPGPAEDRIRIAPGH